MAYALKFNGVNEWVNLSSTVTTLGKSHKLHFKTGNSVTRNQYISGHSNSVSFIRIFDGILTVSLGNRNLILPNTLITDTEYTVDITHNSSSGAMTVTSELLGNANNTGFSDAKFSRFGRWFQNNHYFGGLLYRYTITDLATGVTENDWNPSLSNGTGTILTDSVGGNDGTLTNFSGTTNSWWESYDDGGSISASLAPTITKPVFSIASSFVAPVTISADIAYTITKPIFTTSASKAVPTFTSDLAFNVAKPVFATAASTTVPIFASALSVDINKPIFAVSAENGQLVITSAIAASISKPVFSVTADNQVLIINSAISLSVSKPIFSVASSNNVPTFTVSTAFDINKPIFSIASTATEPGNASASIAVLVDAPIFSVSTSLINPLLSTIDFSIDAPVFSVLNSATRPTLNAEITVDVTAPTFSVIANNGIQVYYYRSGTQVITYSQNTQIKIRTLNTNQPL